MRAVWSKAPCSAKEVIDRLAASGARWHPKTTKTFLNRLVRKGALGFRRDGRAYSFHPLVTETECVNAAAQTFLERVFQGSVSRLLAHFAQRHQLSPKALRELQTLLERTATRSRRAGGSDQLNPFVSRLAASGPPKS
jgi:BlaI family penicillinase repressor